MSDHSIIIMEHSIIQPFIKTNYYPHILIMLSDIEVTSYNDNDITLRDSNMHSNV